MDNSIRHYILGEVNLSELRATQVLTKKAGSKLNVEKSALEKCDQEYQRFVRLRSVGDKELPLSEKIDAIKVIVADPG